MPDSTDVADYCRQIETYLCQKNEGHLIRVVGPSFDLVARWASDGVPLKVAFRGIDRTVERYYRTGPRRRPVRIDFCAADVLDVFDEWRRATGLSAAEARGEEPAHPVKRAPSLADHLQRALLRLTQARVAGTLDERADPIVDRVSRELDAAKANRRGLRGEEREALIGRLAALDGELVALARASLTATSLSELEREAVSDLAAFRDRMPADALERARSSAIEQAIRDRLRLPTLAFAHA